MHVASDGSIAAFIPARRALLWQPTKPNGEVSLSTFQIGATAPGLFTAEATGRGLANGLVLRVKASGTQSYEPIGQFDPQQNRFVTRPIELGAATEQVFLVLYGTGTGGRAALENVSVKVGRR